MRGSFVATSAALIVLTTAFVRAQKTARIAKEAAIGVWRDPNYPLPPGVRVVQDHDRVLVQVRHPTRTSQYAFSRSPMLGVPPARNGPALIERSNGSLTRATKRGQRVVVSMKEVEGKVQVTWVEARPFEGQKTRVYDPSTGLLVEEKGSSAFSKPRVWTLEKGLAPGLDLYNAMTAIPPNKTLERWVMEASTDPAP